MKATTSDTWQMMTVENSGLSANHVTDIVEDAAGDLWFATYGGGLCRRSADGRGWKTYRAADGLLVGDYVGAIAVDGAGRVWAVCDARTVDGVDQPGGICVLSPDGSGQVFPRAADEYCIVALEADRKGTMWFRIGGIVVSGGITRCDGTRSGPSRFEARELRSFDGATWTTYDGDRAAIAAWYPHRRACTRLGWQLVGDTVWLLESIDSTASPGAEPPSQPSPSGPTQDAQTGTLPLSPEMEAMVSEMNRFAQTMQTMRFMPGMGSFFYDYCLTAYDGQEWKKQADLPSPFRFGELVVDWHARAWVSLIMLGDVVMGNGVARFDGEKEDEKWTVFDKDAGLLSDYVAAISADSRGNVWLSHMMGSLSRWDGARWIQCPGSQDGRGDQDLGRCLEDRQGRLWFPSQAGVAIYTP